MKKVLLSLFFIATIFCSIKRSQSLNDEISFDICTIQLACAAGQTEGSNSSSNLWEQFCALVSSLISSGSSPDIEINSNHYEFSGSTAYGVTVTETDSSGTTRSVNIDSINDFNATFEGSNVNLDIDGLIQGVAAGALKK